MKDNIITKHTAVFGFFTLLYIAVFSPALFGGGSFVIHDNMREFFPAFLTNPVLWESKIGLGFPTFADPQQQMFYPFQYLFPKTITGFNFYVIHVIILGSFFTYLFAHELTGSVIASIFAGIIFGMSGSMSGQITMFPVATVSAYLPALVHSYYLLLKNPRRYLPFLMAVLFTALSFLGGHPQYFAFNMLLVGIMVLFFIYDRKLHLDKMIAVSAALILGLIVAGVLLLPFLQLLKYTIRSGAIDTVLFQEHQMQFSHLIRMVYPFFYGGVKPNILVPIIDHSNESIFHEMLRYFGLLPVLLILPGISVIREKRLRWFFIFGLIFYLLYSMGTNTPVGWIFYEIPLLNRFRAPVRHFLEITFLVSILTSIYIRYLFDNRPSMKTKFLWAALAVVVIILPGFYYLLQMPYTPNFTKFNWLSLFNNNLIIFQILILLSILIVLMISGGKSRFIYISFTLILITILDLTVNQYQSDWSQYSFSGSKDRIFRKDRDSIVTNLHIDGNNRIQAHKPNYLMGNGFSQRYYVSGGNIEMFLSNFNIVNNIPLSNIYNPLFLKHTAVLTMIGNWNIHREKLGFYGVKYNVGEFKTDRLLFNSEYSVGNCGMNDVLAKLMSREVLPEREFPETMKGNHLNFYTSVVCATKELKIGDPTIGVDITSSDGRVLHKDFVYGIDTYLEKSRCDNKALSKNTGIKPSIDSCRSYYKTDISLPAGFIPDKLRFYDHGNMLTVVHGVSVDKDKKYYNVNYFPYAGDNKIKSYQYRNLTALEYSNASSYLNPAACVKQIKDDIIIMALLSGKLLDPTLLLLGGDMDKMPDFDIYEQAMLSSKEKLTSRLESMDCSNKIKEHVQISNLKRSNGMTEFDSSSDISSYMVMNETYYPGWHVKVNGKVEDIYRTNSMVQGFYLPEGKNHVEVYFFPYVMLYGALVSITGILILILYYLYTIQKKGNDSTRL